MFNRPKHSVSMKEIPDFCTIRALRHIIHSYLKDLSHVGGNENIKPGRNDFFEQTAAGTSALLSTRARQCVFQHSEQCVHSARLPQTQTSELSKLWTPGTFFHWQDKTLKPPTNSVVCACKCAWECLYANVSLQFCRGAVLQCNREIIKMAIVQ